MVLNTAQVLIFFIGILSIVIVGITYQINHQPPAPAISQITIPDKSAQHARYIKQMAGWEAAMLSQELVVTWPYLGQDNVIRIDLPGKVPITLADWDFAAEGQVALSAYRQFTEQRVIAKVAQPGGCIVHVFDTSGDQVADASASGVVTAEERPLNPQ